MNLLLATSNKDKVKEIKELISNRINLLTISNLNIEKFEVEEDGKTLKENAYKKAKTLYDIAKISTMADDTGLFVESLNLRPGVFSHRYAGDNPSYKDNRNRLLKELKGKNDRSAYFITVICFIDPMGNVHYFEGRIDGEITLREYGYKDFGYDQIFKAYGSEKTFGQMNEEEKNLYSHRFKALKKFNEFIEANYESISSK